MVVPQQTKPAAEANRCPDSTIPNFFGPKLGSAKSAGCFNSSIREAKDCRNGTLREELRVLCGGPIVQITVQICNSAECSKPPPQIISPLGSASAAAFIMADELERL
jgi:hypothetical protein